MYLFPFAYVNKNDNIVIYGAGKLAKEYYFQIKSSEYCKIQYLIDKNYKNIKFFGMKVRSIEYLKTDKNYDKIVIAIANNRVSSEVYNTLCSIGIDPKKIVLKNIRPMKYTAWRLEDISENINCIEEIAQDFFWESKGNLDYLRKR